MLSLILGLVFVAFTVFACLPNGLAWHRIGRALCDLHPDRDPTAAELRRGQSHNLIAKTGRIWPDPKGPSQTGRSISYYRAPIFRIRKSRIAQQGKSGQSNPGKPDWRIRKTRTK